MSQIKPEYNLQRTNLSDYRRKEPETRNFSIFISRQKFTNTSDSRHYFDGPDPHAPPFAPPVPQASGTAALVPEEARSLFTKLLCLPLAAASHL